MSDADTTSAARPADVIQRGRVEATLRAAAKAQPKKIKIDGRTALWGGIILAGLATLFPIVNFAGKELETWTLLQAGDASVKADLAHGGPAGASPAYLEMLAELGVQDATRNTDAAYAAAQRAVKADPSRAGAWAELAWLDYSKAGKVTPAALDALEQSMDACPVCNQDLIRWRFNFVLANWRDVPDDLRRRAFEQADILRWVGQNREFLGEMRVKAELAGIPFEAYRSAVKTPVRGWDLAPTPQAVAADLLRPRT